jgi:hypothetical protein
MLKQYWVELGQLKLMVATRGDGSLEVYKFDPDFPPMMARIEFQPVKIATKEWVTSALANVGGGTVASPTVAGWDPSEGKQS